MAKVKGPLMSLSASGTVAGLLTNRATAHGAIIQTPPRPTTPPSEGQDAQRARFRAAMSAWHDLDVDTRNEWHAAAAAINTATHLLYTREYMLQRIDAPNQPLIPA